MAFLIGVCEEIKNAEGKPITEILETVTKRQEKEAIRKWQNSLGPGWKILRKKS